MIGPNGMVGYDIVLGRVTYSYGSNSPEENYDGVTEWCIDNRGDTTWIYENIDNSYGKINHSYQIQVRVLKIDKTNSLQIIPCSE